MVADYIHNRIEVQRKKSTKKKSEIEWRYYACMCMCGWMVQYSFTKWEWKKNCDKKKTRNNGKYLLVVE